MAALALTVSPLTLLLLSPCSSKLEDVVSSIAEEGVLAAAFSPKNTFLLTVKKRAGEESE